MMNIRRLSMLPMLAQGAVMSLEDGYIVGRALDAAGHPALLFVDGVSSIGSIDFRMDEWGVDLAVTGSQKGFMLPAGLGIIGVSGSAKANGCDVLLIASRYELQQLSSTIDAKH